MNYSIYSIKASKLWLKMVIITILGQSCALFAADFGVANWGMAPEEIKQLEKRTNLTPFGQTEYQIYLLRLPNIEDARIVYQFENNQLVEGRFLFFTYNALDVKQTLAQYQTIKSLITNQYGPANSDQTIRAEANDQMVTTEVTVNELASDRLILKSSWRSQSANLYHQLAWDSDKPHHQLHYVPIEDPLTNTTSDAF